jgi:hypothetical protein
VERKIIIRERGGQNLFRNGEECNINKLWVQRFRLIGNASLEGTCMHGSMLVNLYFMYVSLYNLFLFSPRKNHIDFYIYKK